METQYYSSYLSPSVTTTIPYTASGKSIFEETRTQQLPFSSITSGFYSGFATSQTTTNGNSKPEAKKESLVKPSILHIYDLGITDKLQLLKTEYPEILMEKKHFGSGGCCEAFRVRFVKEGVLGAVEVAKKFKYRYGFLEEYLHFQMGRAASEEFNKKLSEVGLSSARINFPGWNRILEFEQEFYSVEKFLPGDFTKYNNIFGDAECVPATQREQLCCQVAAAFSHFSFIESGFNYIVLDVQGVDTTFTDAAIVSRVSSQYGYTDTGLPGIQKFFIKHHCNTICKKLHLLSINGNELPPAKPSEQSPRYAKPAQSQWCWLDDIHRSHEHDPDMQMAINAANSQGKKVRVFVGDSLFYVIDPVHTQQQFNILTGEARSLHSRASHVPEEYLVQVQLDDGQWYTYDASLQDDIAASLKAGNEKATIIMNKRRYTLDFTSKTQYNEETGNVRHIRFVLRTYGEFAETE